MSAADRQYAVITGSGFASLGDDVREHRLTTRFGEPSGPVREVDFGGRRVLVLARHGAGHRIPPHRINYRANLAALASANAGSVIALNTVGVIAPGRHPGEIAIPDQLIDYTYGRDHSIYDGESDSLHHIEFTEPFSERLRQELINAAGKAAVSVHGGVYAVMQGPRLETAAEVNRLESDGADYIGMTAMPEAALARELDMDYASLSLIVNYAAGRGQGAIHADLEENTTAAKSQAMKILQALFAGR